MLALSWNIQTINGAGRDPAGAESRTPHAPRRAALPSIPTAAAPRKVTRAGTDAIEAIFKFETAVGRGSGIIRLIPDAADGNTLKAWTLLDRARRAQGL